MTAQPLPTSPSEAPVALSAAVSHRSQASAEAVWAACNRIGALIAHRADAGDAASVLQLLVDEVSVAIGALSGAALLHETPQDGLHGWIMAAFGSTDPALHQSTLPLSGTGPAIGSLMLGFREPAGLADAVRPAIESLLRQAALSIELLRARQIAQRLAVAADYQREAAEMARLEDLGRATEALQICTDRLIELDDLQGFFDTVVQKSIVGCGAAAGSIGLAKSDFTGMQIVAIIDDSGEDGALVVPEGVELFAPMTDAIRNTWTEFESATGCWWITPEHAIYHEGYRRWHRRRGHRHICYFPVRLLGRAIGFLALSYREGEKPSEAQLAVSRVLAQQIGLAVGMTQLADAARLTALAQDRVLQTDATNEALRRSIERTAAEESLPNVLCSIIDEASHIAGARGGLISAIQSAAGQPFETAAICLQGQQLSKAQARMIRGIEPADGSGIFLERIRRGEELLLCTEPDDANWWKDGLEFMQHIGARTCLCLPIRARGAVVGLFTLWLPQAGPPSPLMLMHLRTFAHQAALSLELLRFREATQEAATEAERARVAGEIHDGLAQAFTGILMQARAAIIAGYRPSRDLAPFLSRIESLAASGLDEARRSVFALRSMTLENEGLVFALQRLVENLSIDGQLQFRFVDAASRPGAPPSVEDAIYRIAQEAAQNALKHADATDVRITLETIGERLVISVEDDGIGIASGIAQTAREEGGLKTMHRRAQQCGGHFSIEPVIPRGTRIVASFPCDSNRQGHES